MSLRVVEVQHAAANPTGRRFQELGRTKPFYESRALDPSGNRPTREVPKQCRRRRLPPH